MIYHKAPIKSSEFVQIPIWQKVQNLNPNLLLIHARKTSPGIGHAKYNDNNHPFVSEDRRIGVIHNGKIHEASFLEYKYETQTDCDSEIILRMYENSLNEPSLKIENVPSYMQERLHGISELWSVLNQGSCASMIGELHVDGSRTVMLFRNEKRPLWIADLRETLGQIFFCSETEIWHTAIASCGHLKEIGSQKLAELPINEVWGLKIDEKNPIVTKENFHRVSMKIDRSVSYDWSAGNEKKPIQAKKMELSIITDLDKTGNAPHQVPLKTSTGVQPIKPYVAYNPSPIMTHEQWQNRNNDQWLDRKSNVFNESLAIEYEGDDDTMLDDDDRWKKEHEIRNQYDDERYFEEECQLHHTADQVATLCEKIKNTIDQVETNFNNSAIEGNVTIDDSEELIHSLQQIQQDLESNLFILNI